MTAVRDPKTGKFQPAVAEPEPEPPMVPEFECPLCHTRYYSAKTICQTAGSNGDDLDDHGPCLVQPLSEVSA